jgi:nuclear transport factor 2 (NTF2) superfamily protein
LTLIEAVNDEYLKRDAFTCEHCRQVNVLGAKSASRRTKRAHMVYCDDMTWFSLRAASATLGMNMGSFLAFLNGLWQREHRNLSTITEDTTGVSPRR